MRGKGSSAEMHQAPREMLGGKGSSGHHPTISKYPLKAALSPEEHFDSGGGRAKTWPCAIVIGFYFTKLPYFWP